MITSVSLIPLNEFMYFCVINSIHASAIGVHSYADRGTAAARLASGAASGADDAARGRAATAAVRGQRAGAGSGLRAGGSAAGRVSRAPTAARPRAALPPPRLSAARSPHAAPAPAPLAAWPARPGQMCSLAALARGCRPAAAAAKPCCLCWCCCCSCSWAKCLAVRGSEGGPGKKPGEFGPQEPLLSDGDAPPTLDEIQSWGQSFDRLMRSAAGRKVFRDFLRGEYSEENIMFWLACEELKRETDPDAVEEKARFIYEDYISILSPKEVSLDSRVREVVNRNMVEPTPHTFDDAQLQIYTLMHRDSYPRFVNSPLYKTLARLSSAEPPGAAPGPSAPPGPPALPAPAEPPAPAGDPANPGPPAQEAPVQPAQ